VIVPAATFIATFEAVSQVEATPVVVDVTDADYCLDADAAAAAVTPRTRALLPVHLYGQLANMKALQDLATAHDLVLVEDACQAHGAERDGLRAGAGGQIAAFSFYPSKNLGAAGDAGALVTDDGDLADRVRSLREHGQREKYRHESIGYTARLDAVQAVVLSRKLGWLDEWTAERRAIASFYSGALSGLPGIALPPVPPGSDPVWHLYVIRTSEPETLAAALAERGIGTGRHYPEAPHLSRAYRELGHAPGAFPVAESLCAEGLSLPLFPGMSEAQMEAVVTALTAICAGG
jgi:dTDP-4-amino-4,6-dideoxygalactose transaminase